jgi:RHS repeat-associated protein
VRELPERRTASSKTYLLSDGSCRGEYFTEQVHVKDSKGAWQEIDLSVVPTASDPDALTTKRSPVAVTFKGQGEGRPVTVKKGAYRAEIDLLDCLEPEPVELGGDVIYPQVSPFTDLTYTPRQDGIKETLVLSSPLAEDTFRFFVALDGLEAQPNPSGGAWLVSSNNVLQGEIDPLYVFDSSSDAGGDPAVCRTSTMTIEPVAGGAYITYALDRSWLTDAERVYPVKVDPTMWFCADGVSDGGVLDSFVFDTQSSSNPTYYYAHEELRVGQSPSSGATFRSLLDFNLSSLYSVPAVRLKSSTMSFYNWYVATTYSHNTYLKRITSYWDYHVYWQTRPSFADYAYQAVWGSAGKWVTWDTKDLVNMWLGGTPEYGVMLMQNTGDSSNWYYSYRSSNYSTGSSYRPRLFVTYDAPSTTVAVSPATTARVGDILTVTVNAKTQDVAYVPQLRVMPHAGAEKFGEIGWFKTEASVPPTWTLHGTAIDGVWASADATAAGTYKLQPIWGLCSTVIAGGDPGYRRAVFKLKVTDALSDVDDLDFDTRFNITSAPAYDTGIVTSHNNVNIAPPVPPVRLQTSATETWFAEADTDNDGDNDSRNDTGASGRGAVTLSWDDEGLAQEGYKLYLSDGATYRLIDTLSAGTSSWTSEGKSLFPTDSWIEANAAALNAGTIDPFASGTHELRDDPRPLYQKTPGNTYDDTAAYFFKLVPLDNGVADPATVADPIAITLDNRTSHLNDDPRHSTAELASTPGGGLALDIGSGGLQIDKTDLSILCYGPEAELSRHYSSESTETTSFAPGWRFGFDRRVAAASDVATYTDECGDDHVFHRYGGSWVSPAGFGATFSTFGSGSALSYPSGEVTYFDSQGRVASHVAATGDSVIYDWAVASPAIESADGSRHIDVERTGGKVTSATYTAGSVTRIVSFTDTVSGGEGTATVEYTYAGGLPTLPLKVAYGYEDSRIVSVSTVDVTSTAEGEWCLDYSSGRLARLTAPGCGGSATASTTVAYDTQGGLERATLTRSGLVEGEQGTVHEHYLLNPSGTLAAHKADHVAGEAEPVTDYTYDANNRQVGKVGPIDSRGARERTISVLDIHGNALYERDTFGNQAKASFDASGHVTAETNALGRLVQHEYDAQGNETRLWGSVNAVESAETSRTFDAHGRVLTESVELSEDAATCETRTYDSPVEEPTEIQRDLTLTDGEAPVTASNHATFDAFGNKTTSTDASGTVLSTIQYDGAGRPLLVTGTGNVITHNLYDALGNMVATWMTSNGHVAGFKRSETDARGQLSREMVFETDGGTIPSEEAVPYQTITHAYDAMGREVSTDDSLVSGLPARTYYDAAGNALRSWREGLEATDTVQASRATFDLAGRQLSATEPGDASAPTVTLYRADGTEESVTSPDGTVTTYSYDAVGSQIEVVSTAEGTTRNAYDIGGRLAAVTKFCGTTDEATTMFFFDQANRQIGSAAARGPNDATAPDQSSAQLNQAGWTLVSTDADEVKTTTQYDICGRQVSEQTGNEASSTTTYDNAGRVWLMIDPDGKVKHTVYDDFGRVGQECQHSTEGTLTNQVYEYDSLSRVVNGIDTVAGVTRHYIYAPGIPKPSVMVECRGSVTTTVTYETNGSEVSRVSSVGTSTVTRSIISTDSAGRETSSRLSMNAASFLSRVREFDEAGRVTTFTATGISGTAHVTYTGARKTAENVTLAYPAATASGEYAYETDGRLISSDTDGGRTYAYDPAGNITSITGDAAGQMSLHYDAMSRIASSSIDASVTLYGWDAANGRRMQQGPASSPDEVTFTYTGTGRLESYLHEAVSGQPSVSAEYEYDALGQRVKSSVSRSSVTTTSEYEYEGLSLLSVSSTSSAQGPYRIDYLYDGEGRPYAGIYSDASGTVPFAMLTTERGDVVELLDSDGEAFAYYRYDSWGNHLARQARDTSALPFGFADKISERQPLRYAGYCFDAEEGLYYLSARTYDPVTRQFLSKDPARADGEESAYQYCGGNPVGKVDPSGLFAGEFYPAYRHLLTSDEAGTMNRAVRWTTILSGILGVGAIVAHFTPAAPGVAPLYLGAAGTGLGLSSLFTFTFMTNDVVSWSYSRYVSYTGSMSNIHRKSHYYYTRCVLLRREGGVLKKKRTLQIDRMQQIQLLRPVRYEISPRPTIRYW